MGSSFKATFDLRETTDWRADYAPSVGKLPSGHESVHMADIQAGKITAAAIAQGETVIAEVTR